jgi:hypothetical protein
VASPASVADEKREEGSSCSISVTGAPQGAKIYYRDALVTENPFRVQRTEVSHPLKVEKDGFAPFTLMVAPSEDRIVQVQMTELPAKVASPAPRPKGPVPAAQPTPSNDLRKGRLGSQFTSEFE